jgi:hemin uptake protein HemP
MPTRQFPTHIKEPANDASSSATRPQAERVITTRELLGDSHRVWIEHAAERYLLQVTRSGKLILTK